MSVVTKSFLVVNANDHVVGIYAAKNADELCQLVAGLFDPNEIRYLILREGMAAMLTMAMNAGRPVVSDAKLLGRDPLANAVALESLGIASPSSHIKNAAGMWQKWRRFYVAAPGNKICRDCGSELPLDEFSEDRRRKDGRVSYCNPCRSKQHKAEKANRAHRNGGAV